MFASLLVSSILLSLPRLCFLSGFCSLVASTLFLPFFNLEDHHSGEVVQIFFFLLIFVSCPQVNPI